MPRKPQIAIVGLGRLGTALAVQLSRAGYTISEFVYRDGHPPKRGIRSSAKRLRAQISPTAEAQLKANVIWFCVPDREIAAAAHALAYRGNWEGKIAFHSSGALTSAELSMLRRKGAAVASVHPLMTFVARAVPSLQRVPFAVEGDASALSTARKIVHNLGGQPFKIEPKNKVAYHAWGGFTSPLLIALLVNAEQVARIAGISVADARRRMLPILKQTIKNYGRLGPAGAFSGPLVRGDAETVRKHLQVLRKIPEARRVYVSLATTALDHLPAQNKTKLKQLLHPKAPA